MQILLSPCPSVQPAPCLSQQWGQTAWMTSGASSVPIKKRSALGVESEMWMLPTITFVNCLRCIFHSSSWMGMHKGEGQVMNSAGFAFYMKCSSGSSIINLCSKRSPGPFPLSLKVSQNEKGVSLSQVWCPQWPQEVFHQGDLLSPLYIFLSSFPILYTWSKANVISSLKPQLTWPTTILMNGND